MEYYSVTLRGIRNAQINHVIKEILHIRQADMLNSILYAEDIGNYQYTDETDLCACCTGAFTAVFHAKQAVFHRPYERVLCMIERNDYGTLDLECSIAAQDFPASEIPALNAWLSKLHDEHIITDAEIAEDYE